MGPHPLTGPARPTPPASPRGRHRVDGSRRPARWAPVVVATGVVLVAGACVALVAGPAAQPAGMSVADLGTAGSTPTALPSITTAPDSAGVLTLPQVVGDPSAGATDLPADPATTAGSTTPSSRALPVPDASPAVAPPLTVTFDGSGGSAPVAAVGVDGDGLMEVPADVDTIGWYRYGPVPGSATGSAVLTGHVDDVEQGPGVFATLGSLEPGDPVEITAADGTALRFEVTARESWPKDEVPLDRLFDRSGPGRLVLITCGGAFDPDALSYDENIAVTAVLVG